MSIHALENKPKAKCRTWQVRVSMGYDPRTGKYPSKTKVVHGTYTDAKRLHDLMQATYIDSKKITLAELCEEYVQASFELGEITQATAVKKRDYLKAVCYHLGNKKIEDLKANAIEDCYRKLLTGDSLSGRKLSGTTVNGIATTLSGALSYAVRRGYLISNPCENAHTPRIDTQEKQALSNEQVKALHAQCAPGDEHHAAIMLALFGGLRRAEIAGLEVQDVDIANNLLFVRGTKSDASCASIPMRAELLEFLDAHLQAKKEEMASLGLELKLDTKVVSDQLGRPITAEAIGRWWRRNREKYGCDSSVTLHTLRHTAITMLARDGVHPRVMQALARHSDPRTTLKIYSHVRIDDQQAAVDGLTRL